MAIIFSPVDGTELDGPYTPRPRNVFLMLHVGDTVSEIEQEMVVAVRAILNDLDFTAITATEVPGTGDFLGKIVDLIRGCGFGVAIYSDNTPPKTLGNIFFEIGVSHLLGKPVQLLVAGADPTPSDFVRTEWVRFNPHNRESSLDALRRAFRSIEEFAVYYFKLGEAGLEADIVDYELTFERFKQAVLIADHADARLRIGEIADRLREPDTGRGTTAHHRQRLRNTISHFLTLLPKRV